jgi:hypothetical protein
MPNICVWVRVSESVHICNKLRHWSFSSDDVNTKLFILAASTFKMWTEMQDW